MSRRLEKYLRDKLKDIPAMAQKAVRDGESERITIPLSTKLAEGSARYLRLTPLESTRREIKNLTEEILHDPSAKYLLSVIVHMYQPQPNIDPDSRRAKRERRHRRWSIFISIH